MIIDKLFSAVTERGPVCVGLDTSLSLVPRGIVASMPAAQAVYKFNCEIIDATIDVAACFKVQIAHYESLGIDGLCCYRDTLAYARSKGALVIADVKRGDIFSTGEMYAKAHLSGDFEADLVTVNPYMGHDVIEPYLPYIEKEEKGVLVLVRTSNDSAVDLQELVCNEKQVFLHMAEQVEAWGEQYRGKCGYSSIGGVVGGTSGKSLAQVRKIAPSLFLLVPGYGAQGGSGKDIALAFTRGNGAVVNASRSILGAYKQSATGEKRYAMDARQAVLSMRDDIKQWIN